jgi:hypothetical protein
MSWTFWIEVDTFEGGRLVDPGGRALRTAEVTATNAFTAAIFDVVVVASAAIAAATLLELFAGSLIYCRDYRWLYRHLLQKLCCCCCLLRCYCRTLLNRRNIWCRPNSWIYQCCWLPANNIIISIIVFKSC